MNSPLHQVETRHVKNKLRFDGMEVRAMSMRANSLHRGRMSQDDSQFFAIMNTGM
jgi:hypothetical protein